MAEIISGWCSLRGTPSFSHLANRTNVCYTEATVFPEKRTRIGGELLGTDIRQLRSGETAIYRIVPAHAGGKAGLVAGLAEQHRERPQTGADARIFGTVGAGTASEQGGNRADAGSCRQVPE